MNHFVSWALLLSTVGFSACAPSSTVAPSMASATTGRALLQEAARHAQTQALGHHGTDWDSLVAELQASIPADAPPASGHDAIRVLLVRYGDPHARLVERAPAPSEVPAPGAAALSSQSAAPAPQPAHPPIPTLPEGRLLPDRIAYVLLPGCPGATADERMTYARSLRSTLQRLDTQHPAGWMIDLRLNGGGNVWPTLAGLWPLLGDGVHATSMGAEGLSMRMGCDAGSAWLELNGARSPQQTMDSDGTPNLVAPAPRAVLIGSWTMSSGELIASALRGCNGTRLFGEPTAGLTTVTNNFPLSDGSVLVLPVDRMGDRNGAPLGDTVRPDQTVESAAWPTSEDSVAVAAKAWLRSEVAPAAAREAHLE